MKNTNIKYFYVTLVMGFMFFCGTAQSATYYIDNVGGSDGADGISTSTPWQHCPGDPTATVNANRTLAAGDIIVFKGGVTYNFSSGATDYIAANASGTAGSPIIYRSGHIHSTPWPDAINRAVIDGTNANLNYSSGINGIISLKNYSYITIEGLELKNQAVNGDPLGFIGANGDTFNHIIIDGCYLHFANSAGIILHGSFTGCTAGDSCIMKNNIIEDTWGHNIMLRYGLKNVLIEGNRLDKPGYDVYNAGNCAADNICINTIDAPNAYQENIIIRGNDIDYTTPVPTKGHMLISIEKNLTGLLIENNYFHGVPKVASLLFYATLTDATIRNNVFHVYPTTYEGIIRFYNFRSYNNIHGLNIYNNTFVSTPKLGGIIYLGNDVNTDPTIFYNVNIRNNIIDNDGRGALVYIKQNLAGTGPVVDMPTFVCDYNVYNHGPQPDSAFFAWSNGNKTFSQWQTLTGLDAHSTVGAVSFIDRAGADFRLQATDERARDKGTDLFNVLYDKIGTLRPVGAAFDIGAYEYVGGGSSDRQALLGIMNLKNSRKTCSGLK